MQRPKDKCHVQIGHEVDSKVAQIGQRPGLKGESLPRPDYSYYPVTIWSWHSFCSFMLCSHVDEDEVLRHQDLEQKQ